MERPRICMRWTASGGRCRGPRPRRRSTRSPTACSRWVSPRARPSHCSAGPRSNGRSSTSRSLWSVPSEPRSTPRARSATCATSSSTHARSGCSSRTTDRLPRSPTRCRMSSRMRGSTSCEREGREYAAANPDALRERADSLDEDDLFTFIYTSGTTGPPKACMIRHRNYYAMVQKGDELEERLTRPGDVMLLYLPLAHNYGRLLHLSGAYIGFTIAFLPDPMRAAAELQRVRPTLFPSVPRVYEKIYATVTARFEAETGVRRKLVDWALRVGREVSVLRQAERPIPPGLARRYRLADRLVYSKVKERLGGRLRIANAGGAPLSREIAEFFHSIDILILEGYGLSEVTTAATVNRPEAFKFGTVGKPMPGVELEFEADGEILIRSNTVFAGYYRDPEATAEVLDEAGIRPHRRHRPSRRGRLPRDHRPQEGHHRHRRRQERRPAEPRERAEGPRDRLAGARDRRSPALHRRPDHTRPRRGHRRVPSGGQPRDRCGQRRPVGVRADQAVPDPAARLLARARRADPDAEDSPQGDPRPLRRGRRERCTTPTRGCGGRRRSSTRTSLRRGWRP